MYLYFGIQNKQNLVHRSMYANMPICTYAHIWKYESMQLCKFASMHVHAYMQERACPYPRLRDFYVYNENEPVVLYCTLYRTVSLTVYRTVCSTVYCMNCTQLIPICLMECMSFPPAKSTGRQII